MTRAAGDSGPYNMWYLTMLMPQDIVGGAVLCAPVRTFATASFFVDNPGLVVSFDCIPEPQTVIKTGQNAAVRLKIVEQAAEGHDGCAAERMLDQFGFFERVFAADQLEEAFDRVVPFQEVITVLPTLICQKDELIPVVFHITEKREF